VEEVMQRYADVEGEPNHWGGHDVGAERSARRPSGLVEVTVSLARSERLETSWKNRLAASGWA